jgi:Smg protein
MIEIFVYLFNTYQDFAAQPAPEALASKLKAAGFSQPEVQAALEWLAALRPAGGHAALPLVDPTARRIYAAEEVEQLGSEGIAFLGFLEQQHLLDARLRELIIERAAAFGEEMLDLERLKIIVLMALWSQERSIDGLLIEELLSEPGETMH